MYTHSQPVNVHNQIASPGVDDDGAPADPIDHHHHIHYEDGTPTVVVDDVSPDSVYVTAGVAASELGIQPSDGSSQLTLTFRWTSLCFRLRYSWQGTVSVPELCNRGFSFI